MLTASERQTLADELTNDPDSLGYTVEDLFGEGASVSLEDIRAAREV